MGIHISYVHIKEVLYKLTNGCTEPVRCILDDDSHAIVKLYNNPQGNLTLVNEYICYRLANVLELPTAESGICLIDKVTIDNNLILSDDNFGFCFFSKYLDKSATFKASIVPVLANIDDFYKLILFDHIIYNKDRNIFNLLVQYYKNKITFTLIDHSHVFKNETLWDANCFRFGVSEDDFNDYEILKSNEAMYSMFYHTKKLDPNQVIEASLPFKKHINRDILLCIISEVPDEWGIASSEMMALVDYILYRVNHIDEICILINEFVKNK